MPGLQGLNAMVQPITGPASVQAATQALDPRDAALAAQGIDPFGQDVGQETYMGALSQLQNNAAIPAQPGAQPAQGLSPQDRAAIGMLLNDTLNALGTPTDESTASAAASIQSAIMALGGQQ